MNKSRKEAADQLKEIEEKIRDLLDWAENILRRVDPAELDRANHYWLAHMRMALSDDHGYLSKDHTIQDSVEALAQARCEVCGDEAPDGAELCGDCQATKQEHEGNEIAERAEKEAEERHAGEDVDPEDNCTGSGP